MSNSITVSGTGPNVMLNPHWVSRRRLVVILGPSGERRRGLIGVARRDEALLG